MPETVATEQGTKRTSLHQLAVIGETFIAIVLAIFGAWHIWNVREPDAWTGFALIGLALVFYMMRGQIITKLSFNKEGFEAEMQQKVNAALEKADAAVQKADVLNKVVTQEYGAPKNASSAPAVSRLKETKGDIVAGEGWADPKRKRDQAPENDPQKGQWGGKPERNDRLLDADYQDTGDGWVNLTLRVSSIDPVNKPLLNKVRFHLHDTFRRSVLTVRPKDNVAELKRYASGAFTVGAEVENEPETYLELDLAKDRDAPAEFRLR